MGSIFGKSKKALPDDFAAVLKECESHLPQDPQKAFTALRPIFLYPGRLDTEEQLMAGIEALAAVSAALGAREMTAAAELVRRKPYDAQAIYDLGFQAYENRIYDVGATLLAYGHKLHPKNVPLLLELVTCLEHTGHHEEACKFLKEGGEDAPLCHYLLGFNLLMCGRIEEATEEASKIVAAGDEQFLAMKAALEAMTTRAAALADHLDVRGWHLALNGCLLLHMSPHGFDQGMNGRFCFVADNYTLCKEGLTLLKEALDRLAIEVPRVYKLPERSSEVLALAAAEFFGSELAEWPGTDPGLVVCYDLEHLSDELLQSLYEPRPGILLWSHASNWVEPFPWSPDITTFLYQVNTTPWQAGRLVMDPETQKMTYSEEDEASTKELARRVLDAEPVGDSQGGTETLLALLDRKLPLDVAPGWMGGERGRERQRKGSPVRSSQFL